MRLKYVRLAFDLPPHALSLSLKNPPHLEDATAAKCLQPRMNTLNRINGPINAEGWSPVQLFRESFMFSVEKLDVIFRGLRPLNPVNSVSCIQTNTHTQYFV